MKGEPNVNYYWTALLIEELIRQGCTHFVVAPGSRSTPLAAAVANNARAKYTVTFDERSAGFYALGHAKATGYPAAIIVTSGTAVANLMPAVVEASLDRIPLIVLSADRPPELHDVQANQTIYQNNFFHPYARWFFALPTPHDMAPPSMILSVASFAMWQSRYPMAGPVQLNCPFREPLIPSAEAYDPQTKTLGLWPKTKEPFTRYEPASKRLDTTQISSLATIINSAKQGLFVVGAVKDAMTQQAILKLARALSWPLCADIASGLRQHEDALIIRHDHHVFLHHEVQKLSFDVVLQIGGRLISKTLEQMLAKRHGQKHILVDDHPKRSDPGLTVTNRLDVDIETFAHELSGLVDKSGVPHSALPLLREISGRTIKIIDSIIAEGVEASEPFVARHISKTIDKDSMLMACTSMPIRDYHMFAISRPDGGPVVVVNRGASGIDGLISTAIGFAQASQKRSTVLIGDLAFMHDANALALLKNLSMPMCVVVINNGGGGIFSFLPIAKFPQILTPFIDAPHDHDLSGLPQTFGIEHCRVKTKAEFVIAYENAQACEQHKVIEVMTERTSNYLLHERIKKTCEG